MRTVPLGRRDQGPEDLSHWKDHSVHVEITNKVRSQMVNEGKQSDRTTVQWNIMQLLKMELWKNI